MIKTLMQLPVYLCIATCIAEAIYLGSIAANGKLGKGEMNEIAAIVYGVDRETVIRHYEKYSPEEFIEPVDLEALEVQEQLRHFDIDVRENAIIKAIDDLKFYEEDLNVERNRYDNLRLDFERRWALIGDTSSSQDVVELRQTLQAMTPAQAKEQIIRLFELSKQNVDEEIANDAVAIIRTMPIDKQRKIVAEFRTPQEKERLAEILRLIRTGVPEVPLIQRTRARLDQFDPGVAEP